ncbi:MAG: preprotein translocase subunit SecE [Bifidobacteriaceae bacterium]|jgi:preprotein translocase subunit SecE|nr:preprotein translocase subunit SecE [Bifidobacteriaceae bacterium]
METQSEDVEKVGVFERISTFVNQTIDEMKKVVYPTRKETITYILVVLAFVTIMMLLITGVDYLLGLSVTWLFT